MEKFSYLCIAMSLVFFSGCGRPDPTLEAETNQGNTDPIFCPSGTTLDTKYTLCIRGDTALGPFSTEMAKKCAEQGGGTGCKKETWAINFARSIRGTGRCQPGTTYAQELKTCAAGEEVFGPFLTSQVNRCRALGGGNACDLMRWHKSFVAVDQGGNGGDRPGTGGGSPDQGSTADNRQLPYQNSLRDGSLAWKPEWSIHVANALDRPRNKILLDQSIPTKDRYLLKICPRFNALKSNERKVFWAYFFAVMAKHESSFNNDSKAYGDGGGNTSIGLLQLSYEDVSWAGEWGCEASRKDSERSLTLPRINLECAAAIMSRQYTIKNGRVFLDFGENLYWAVLAPSQISDHPKYNVMSTFNSYKGDKLPFCTRE